MTTDNLTLYRIPTSSDLLVQTPPTLSGEYPLFSHMQESDPHGKDPHQPGAKLDAGKNMMSLVMMDMNMALERVAAVATYGANKYTKGGWLHVPNGQQRYTDALFRHLLKEPNELLDPDTGIEHAAHAAWNALARLQLMLLDHAGLTRPIAEQQT